MGARSTRLLAAILVTVSSAGCATRLDRPDLSKAALEAERREQQALALKLLLDRQERLWRVSTRLKVAGQDLCGNAVTPLYGMYLVSFSDLTEEQQQVASRVELGPGVRVKAVLEGSPAEIAGVQPGVQVLEANGEQVNDLEDLAEGIEEAHDDGLLELVVQASGQPETRLRLQGVKGCKYPIAMSEDDSVNAFADGEIVAITTGMVRFVESDDELALVVGHEIAHNALGHIREHKVLMGVGAGLGLILDVAAAVAGANTQGGFTRLGAQLGSAANQTFSKEHEADADYMGIYLARRAGYEIDEAPYLWRRMAAEHPAAIKDNMMASHPSTPERAAGLQAAIDEITSKESAGLALTPRKRGE